jgi:NADPH-dependent glutamate synthase beta subunit-like oxidoreductase
MNTAENDKDMDFLRPENLLRFGYKDCVLCDVERKGEEKRCERCSGRLDQRDRLLWEIRRDRTRREAGVFSLVYPGLGHFHVGRHAYGIFWASLLPLSLGLVLNVWRGITYGHAFLLLEAAMIWWLAWVDVRRGPRETVAPCEAACPAGIRVPDYIALVREGRPLEALALVHDRLPFASFCGRGCPHPCEQECVRNEFGAPISIMAIKRYAADRGYATGIRPSPEIGNGAEAPRVAVIGAGPAGLCAADTLARLGSHVTVYDSREEAGGMMRYGAAEFRFPGDALEGDMKHIFARGIVFRGGVAVGGGLTFEALARERFDAVLVAAGTPVSLTLPGSGGADQGFHEARTFLQSVRQKRPVHLSGRVVVIGGGDVGVDVARTALRLGASEVAIACIESRKEMPAHPWEIEDAVAEGVVLHPSTAVKRFLLRDGRVEGIEALRVARFDRDGTGRVVPHTIPGSETSIAADTVVVAVGSRADLGFLPPVASRLPVDAPNHVFRLIFQGNEFNIPVYMCGDCASGPGTVVEASASGRAAALNIYSHLRVEEGKKARYKDNYRRRPEPHVADRPEWRVRLKGMRMAPEERRGNFEEVEKGFTGECARKESERCARCNLWL